MRSSDSSSDDSGSAGSDDNVEPNSTRVKAGSYGANHYDQLQEFRDDHAAYISEGNHGKWPADEALTFIAKKFARPGTPFARKSDKKGVKRVFAADKDEHEHACVRTVQVYDMADEIAELRLERHQTIASHLRRLKGIRCVLLHIPSI